MHFLPRVDAVLIYVASEPAAREMADGLVGRGYTTVAVGPREVGPWWRVVGFDQGPYPSDDEAWWQGVEYRVVDDFLEVHGGSASYLSVDPEMAGVVLANLAVVVERPVEEVAAVRVAVLATHPARTAAPVVVHGLGRSPSDERPGTAIALPGLADVGWSALEHAYGPADDAPGILLALAANDDGWRDANSECFGTLIHQGTCYSAAPPGIGFLAAIILAPELAASRRLTLLADLAYAATLDGPARPGSWEERAAAAVVAAVPELLGIWEEAGPGVRAWLMVLAAFDPAAAPAARFQEFRRTVPGPSPALDLALALIEGDEDAAIDLTLDAAAWDDDVPRYLRAEAPVRMRQLHLLVHFALVELATG